MGMFIFNWRGLAATVVVSVPIFIAMGQLEAAGWKAGPLFCFVAIGITLPLSMFGYTFDRCDRPGVLLPYWDNFKQVANESFGAISSEDNPDRRTAFCLWPLALGPYFIVIIYIVFWICFAVSGDPFSLLPYLGLVVVSAVAAAIYGKAIEERRVIVIDLGGSDDDSFG